MSEEEEDNEEEEVVVKEEEALVESSRQNTAPQWWWCALTWYRRMRRNSSVVFPENMGPKMTDIEPRGVSSMVGVARRWQYSKTSAIYFCNWNGLWRWTDRCDRPFCNFFCETSYM